MTTRPRPACHLATSIALGVFGLLAHSPSAFAQTTLTWTGATDQVWDNGGNWDTGNAPVSTDDIRFDGTAGQFTVDLGTANRTVAGLTLDSATAYTLSNPQGVWLAPGDVTVTSGTGHTFATTINLAAGTTPTYTIASGADLTISGVIDEYEGGTAGLTKAGDGTLILTANNLYAGTTTITGGTLQLGDGGTTGSVKGDIVNDGTLVFNRSNNLTYSGVISGTGNLTKEGSGTLTLSGDSTFSGATHVNAGTLAISYNHPDALGDSAVTVGASGTVYLDDNDDGTRFALGSLSGSGAVVITNSGILEVGGDNASTTFSGTITATATSSSPYYVTKSGTGTLTLSAADLYLSNLHVDVGELKLDGTTGRILGETKILAGATLTVQNVGTDLDLGLLINSGEALVTGAGTTLKASTAISNRGQLTLTEGASAQSNYFYQNDESTTTVDQASLTVGYFDSFARGTISLTDPTSGGSALTVGRNSNNSTFAGVIEDYTSGPGSVTKVGTNTVILTGANTYTGGTTLTAGTLQLGDGSTTGSLVGDVANDGTLVFKRSDTATFSGLISGTGSVEQAGSGTTILTGDHTYTGGTTVSAGTLQLGDGGTTGSLVGDVTTTGGTLAFNHSDDVTFAGTISGSGGLTQAGDGTLILTADNSFTGTTTISAGTLQLGNGGTTGTVAGDIANGGALVVNRSNDFTLSGVITGTGSLTKEGAGTLTLTGHSTFSGDTVINSGAISIASLGGTAYPLRNSTVELNVDDGLVISGSETTELGALTGSGSIYVNPNSSELYVGYNNLDTVYSGNIGGVSQVYKEGTGTWSLTGTDLDFTAITVDQGSLVLDGATGSVASLAEYGGLVTVQNGADITLSSGSFFSPLTVTGPATALLVSGSLNSRDSLLLEDGASLHVGVLDSNSSNTITVNQASLTIDAISASDETSSIQIGDPTGGSALTFDLADAATFAGVISDTSDADGTVSGSVLKSGVGTLTLTADSTYTGGTTISAGTLQLGTGGTTGAIVGDVVNNGTLAVNRSNDLILGAVTGTGVLTKDGAGTLTLTGDTSYTGTTTITAGALRFAGDGATASLSGTISGTGALTQDGTGTLILAANNTYTGGTTITDGTLQLGSGGTTGTVVGDIVNDGALVLNHSNFLSFGNLISGTGSLEQAGGGFTILAGTNTFSGATTITGGTLLLGNALALQNSTLTLNGAGSFDFNGTDATLGGLAGTKDLSLGSQAITIGNNGDDTTYAGVLSGTGSLTKTGAGTLTLTGANTYAGGTTINAGTLQLGDGGTSGSIFGDVTATGGALAFNHSDNVTFTGAISGAGGVTQNGTGVLSLTGANTFTGDLTLNAGQVLLGSATAFSANTIVNNTTDGLDLNGFDATLGGLAGTGDLALGTQSLTVGSNATPTTYAGTLSGDGGLTKTGTGTLVLSGANTYTGGTTISAGTLQLGNAGASGSILGDVVNAGTLVFNRSDTATFSGIISGTGAIEQAGSGTTILTADHTTTGGTTLSAGTLQLGDGGTTGSLVGNVTTATGSTLAFDRSDDVTFANLVSGAGGLTQAGTGTLTLTANNTYNGATTIETGSTLQLGDGGTAGIVKGTIVNNGILVFNRSDNLTYNQAISGAGDLIKEGAGQLTLTGASTFSGATTVNAGIVALTEDNPDALANSAVTIESGGKVDATDDDDYTFASLSGSGVLLLSNRSDLEVGKDNATTTFSGTIETAGGTPESTLIKTGTGTLTFAGADFDLNTLRVSEGGVVLDGTSGYIFRTSVYGELKVQNIGTDLDLVYLLNYGDTLITGADIVLNVAQKISNRDTGLLTLSAGATVGIENYFYQANGATTVIDQASLSFGALEATSSGTISLSDPTGGGAALTFGQDGSDSSTFAGVIEDYTSGPGSVTKVGTNTFVLSGANTHSGTTTISGGQIVLGNALALQNSTVSIDVDDGLDLNGLDATLGGLAGSGNLALGSQALTVGGNGADTTYTGILSGTGSLTKTGDGILILTGDHTYTGGTTIDGGTLQLGNGGTTGIVIGDIVNNGTLTIDRTDNFTFSGLISGTGDLAFTGTGRTTLDAANTFSGTTTIESGFVTLGKAFALQNSTVDLSRSYSLSLNNSNATFGALNGSGNITVTGSRTLTVGGNGADTTYSGSLQGGGSLSKQGDGTMILSGNNIFSGGTTVSAGTLQIGDGGTTGVLPGDVTNNAALVFNRSDDLTYAGVISGTGSLTQAGTGTLVLTGDNTTTGGTSISAGTLQLGAGGTTGFLSGDVTTAAGTTLAFNRSDDITYAGIVTGAGSLLKEGAGTLTLSTDNHHSGGTTIRGGTIVDTLGDGLGTGPLTLDGGTLTLTHGTDLSRNVTVTANGGTLNVGGLLSIGSDLTVDGTLAAADGLLLSGNVSGNGTFADDVVVMGTLSPGHSPGTLTFDGDLILDHEATLRIELGGLLQGNEYDYLDIGGALTLGGTLEIVAYGDYTPQLGDNFQVFSASSIGGTFAAVNLTGFAAGTAFDISQISSGLISVNAVSAVPEPSTWAGLAGLAALGAAALRRRQRGKGRAEGRI